MSDSRKGRADYDSMKSMLNIMRVHNKATKKINSKLIKEDDANRVLSDEELKQEQDDFKRAVAINTDFEDFNLYKDNAQFSGLIHPYNIAWTFSLEDQDGLYITLNNFQIRDDAFEILQKLKAYYLVWREKWEKEISGLV